MPWAFPAVSTPEKPPQKRGTNSNTELQIQEMPIETDPARAPPDG